MKLVVLTTSILSFLVAICFLVIYFIGGDNDNRDSAFQLMVVGWLMLITSFHID